MFTTLENNKALICKLHTITSNYVSDLTSLSEVQDPELAELINDGYFVFCNFKNDSSVALFIPIGDSKFIVLGYDSSSTTFINGGTILDGSLITMGVFVPS